MRRLLLAAAILAVPTVASAQYYVADPAPAPGVVVTTPGAPMVQGQVYLAPGATYVAPGQQYSDQPIFIDGPPLLSRLLVGLGSAALRAEALVVVSSRMRE